MLAAVALVLLMWWRTYRWIYLYTCIYKYHSFNYQYSGARIRKSVVWIDIYIELLGLVDNVYIFIVVSGQQNWGKRQE